MRAATVALFCLACGQEPVPALTVWVPPPPDLDAPSDEMFELFQEAVAAGVTVDDSSGHVVTWPADGAVLSRESIATFRFEPANGKSVRHLCAQGTFIWLRFEGTGQPIDVVGGCQHAAPFTSWTPDVIVWALFHYADGPLTMTITNATFDERGILIHGPFRSTTPTITFSME